MSLNRNAIQGSAICAFNLSAINAAFSGPFKHQENIQSLWLRRESESRNAFECEFRTMSHDIWTSSQRYQLMDEAVNPITTYPLHISKLETFTHIALDTIPTKLHDKVQIIFVATDQNLVKKIAIFPSKKETCLIEIWEPEMDKTSKILSLQFLKHTESLYISTKNSIIRVPVQHCDRHKSKANCFLSMDPYCGWDDLQQVCSAAPDGDPQKRFWIQPALNCSIRSSPINGGWSSWSKWLKCSQHFDDNRHESNNIDSCLCRTRSCSNPIPKNGGKTCEGKSKLFFIFVLTLII